ncbi:MAG: hypothetical protein R2716_10025 [Microthrixaceae bacterium]
MTVAVVLLGLAVAALAALVISLLRSHADILRILDDAGFDLEPGGSATGAPPGRSDRTATAGPVPGDGSGTIEGVPGDSGAMGRSASGISGVSPSGDAVSFGLAGTETLVAFLTSGCTTCHRFWEAFAEGDQLTDGHLEDGTALLVVTQGEESESPAAVGDLAGTEVPVVMSTDAWEDFGSPWRPTSCWSRMHAWSARARPPSGPRSPRCSRRPAATSRTCAGNAPTAPDRADR